MTDDHFATLQVVQKSFRVVAAAVAARHQLKTRTVTKLGHGRPARGRTCVPDRWYVAALPRPRASRACHTRARPPAQRPAAAAARARALLRAPRACLSVRVPRARDDPYNRMSPSACALTRQHNSFSLVACAVTPRARAAAAAGAGAPRACACSRAVCACAPRVRVPRDDLHISSIRGGAHACASLMDEAQRG